VGKVSGDGILGFSRSFLTAGAPSLVVSLWSVPDESTGYLMEHFYQRLQNGKDKAQSLRGAMLDTKQKFPNPGSWAAFTLLGESAVAPGSRSVAGNPESTTKERMNLVAFTMPVPLNVQAVRQDPNLQFEDAVSTISFDTAMSVQELFNFYKTAMEGRGLKSVALLERLEAHDFNLLFRGPWGDREISIAGSESNGATNTRTVSLRFDFRRDDDAELSPAANEKFAGIMLPPHATGLKANVRFQPEEGKADITFLTSLSLDQVRALYGPLFKSKGFTAYPSNEKKYPDKLTAEFHGAVKDRALFLDVSKSFAHPERQEVNIHFGTPSAN